MHHPFFKASITLISAEPPSTEGSYSVVVAAVVSNSGGEMRRISASNHPFWNPDLSVPLHSFFVQVLLKIFQRIRTVYLTIAGYYFILRSRLWVGVHNLR